jgi:hypothetical protein
MRNPFINNYLYVLVEKIGLFEKAVRNSMSGRDVLNLLFFG